MRQPKSGGGWQAIRYTLRKSRQVGVMRMWRAMRAKNACKTCALGMGGQMGGMVNERGHFPEFCKKSLQAMAADMQGRIESRLWTTYSLDQLCAFSPRELELSGRIVNPVIAEPGDTHYREISWEEALAKTAAAMNRTSPERAFFYVSGRSSNEAGFLLHLWARAYGTNHVSNCSYYCHQASGVGLRDSVGVATATIGLEDLAQADLVFLIGGNPASNHPRLMTALVELRNRGGHVIVVNPVRETGLVNFRVPSKPLSMLFGSDIASEYAQVQIGGDIAFLIGIAKAITPDQDFIDNHTEGFAFLKALIEATEWSDIEAQSGVSRADIERIAKLYQHSERAIFAWTMGITHHEHGVENVQWIANLALLRGMIGKPGAGLLPIRGHSNVQGLGSIGVAPALAEPVIARLAERGFPVPNWIGYDTIAALEAAHRAEMDFALCLGGNLFGATPDAAFASESLAATDTVVYMSPSLNTGHAHGRGKTTIILPVQVRDEEAQSTTQESMFSYIRLSDGGPKRHDGPRSEVDIVADLAELTDKSDHLDWAALRDHDNIRRLIAETLPYLAPIADIGKTKKEFHIPGRLIKEPLFPTPSGKANFRAHAIPVQRPLREDELRLMTVRSEGQFNTVVYEEEDIYRGQDRRDVVLVNPDDLVRMGFLPDQPVDVRNETGWIQGVLIRPFDIAKGCALMYYPEANVLVSKAVDPLSRTPAYKNTIVTITPSTKGAKIRLHAEPIRRGSNKAC